MRERFEVETVVIGAGVVGLATARALALRGQSVVVLEGADQIGSGISSRNSEVIHAGIYYTPGSLKARLCVEGRERLYAYCAEKGVAHQRCGKWIIATHDAQLQDLESLKSRAARSGVALSSLSRAVLQRQPELRAVGGLQSPSTGIVDSHQLMLALQGDLEVAGGQLALNAPVISVASESGRHRLAVGGAMPCELVAQQVVNAAGLRAIPLAREWQGMPPNAIPRQFYARGHYFTYSGKHPFRHLIYPVPEPGGLGIHLTLDLAGQARFGPDVEWIDREDYSIPAERKRAFAEAVQNWWPGLDPRRLQPAYAGIRPKIAGPGEPAADFCIQGREGHGLTGVVQLFGIESPGLTASLAIAEHVANLLEA
ncbi:NAD(P)/FAD-dependent oxidoreductase [Marinobacteraceae bacterium S3BR75-40.1]